MSKFAERGCSRATVEDLAAAASGPRCWRTWWPCEACGGAPLAVSDLTSLRHRPRERERCPSCETLRRRHESAGADPAVWYDTWLGEWVVRLACPGLREGALLPLGFRRFDVAWSEVYRSAADLAYGADALAG